MLLSFPFPIFISHDKNVTEVKEKNIIPISLETLRIVGIKKTALSQRKPNPSKPLSDQKKPSPDSRIISKKISKNQDISKTLLKSYSLNLKEVLKETSFSSEFIPQQSAINIEVETPRGVALDELNPLELKFYIFNKRHFESFGLALYKSYHRFVTENPHVSLYQMQDQKSIAKVVFYPNGRIDEIKLINLAEDKKFQGLFQDTIDNLVLPNPPDELLIDGKFRVYYTLLLEN